MIVEIDPADKRSNRYTLARELTALIDEVLTMDGIPAALRTERS